MKELSNLSPTPGSTKTRKRVGRGYGSGLGKTSGRGHKGAGARTGKGRPAYFEGGQMPLQRRLPKKGFKPLDTLEYSIVNVAALDVFPAGTKVDPPTLLAAGLVRKVGDGIKILGTGDLAKKLDVVAHAFSATARQKIEAAGGTAKLVIEEAGA
jgi:large subunit ribosomal protein L15